MTFNPKPKPVRDSRKKKPVKRITSVCVDCGAWWRGGASEEWHEPDCEHELPVITKRERKTERQMVNEALDELCRRITTWRDGVKCVIHTDGCGHQSQWGHVIPQNACGYLVHNLSNSFRQSDTCNLLHRSVQHPYYRWYEGKFGRKALDMLEEVRKNAPKGGMSTVEMWELRTTYAMMYHNRHQYPVHDTAELVKAGYYGTVIRDAWIKEGRI